MVKKEGVALAGIIAGSDILNVLTSEGGINTPEFLSALDGLNLKTMALVGIFLWLFRTQKEDDKKEISVVCSACQQPASPESAAE